jgi:hypothetical protein
MEEHYRLMALESHQEDVEYRPSDDDDADDDPMLVMTMRGGSSTRKPPIVAPARVALRHLAR